MPLLLPFSVVHILYPTTHFSLLPLLLLFFQLLLSVLPRSSLLLPLRIRIFLVSSYTLLILGYRIFLLLPSSIPLLLFLFLLLHDSFPLYLFLARDGPTLLFLMLLRLLFRNLSLFLLCYPYRSIPLLRPLLCFHSIFPIHFLQSIPSVSSPLHFPCLWIFFSRHPSPLLIFLILFLLFPR
jgi:hypothetical protein